MLEPGQTTGPYAVLSVLGRGASSAVYAVRHTGTGQRLALKVLFGSEVALERRIVREAAVLGRLRHPNIVRTHGMVDVGGQPALLMDWVEGGALGSRVPPGGVAPAALSRWVRGVLAGLGHAHAQGIVHRDIKPDNVLVRSHDDHALLCDFGLVRVLGLDRFASYRTRSGAAMGTLGYMAPEQTTDAHHVDHRADLFAVGAVVYAMATGTAPFPGSDLVDVARRTWRGEYVDPLLLRPELDGGLVRGIRAALQPNPGDRPATAAALARVLLGDDTGIDDRLPAPGLVAAPTYHGDE